MVSVWINYIPIIFLILISIFIIVVLFIISFFWGSSSKTTDFEKLTTYECGFEPFSKNQGIFDVKFYLLAVLFMIFDLEIMFLLPWVLSFDEVTFFSFFFIIWFAFVLTIAFIYEWVMGALNWD